jgi:hypothetical protein
MKRMLLVLLAAAIGAGACTDDPPRSVTPRPVPGPSARTPATAPRTAAEIEIYSAVIRRLILRDHTFGGGPSPFEVVYVVNGAIEGAGRPLRDLFGPAPRPFAQEVVNGIRQRLRDELPPMRFVRDGESALRRHHRPGGVRNDGVIISLGSIRRKRGRVHVPNTLWCGGLCAQWLTYVLSERTGDWRVVGITGPIAVS